MSDFDTPLSFKIEWQWHGFREIMLRFSNFLFISEYSELKNVNSWKIAVGDSWIVDIYGNLKTFDGWWLKVKATLHRELKILWDITKLWRIILSNQNMSWQMRLQMYLIINEIWTGTQPVEFQHVTRQFLNLIFIITIWINNSKIFHIQACANVGNS